MSWLTRFSKQETPLSIASTDARSELPSANTRAISNVRTQINHATWPSSYRNTNSDSVTERYVNHAWSNPDTNSPVAAVWVKCGKGNSGYAGLDIVLVPRITGQLENPSDRCESLDRALERWGFSSGMSLRVDDPETVSGLHKIGLKHFPQFGAGPQYGQAVLMGAIRTNDMQEKTELIEEGRNVIDAFRNSDLLSSNPAIRMAMIDAMMKELNRVRALGTASSNRIE